MNSIKPCSKSSAFARRSSVYVFHVPISDFYRRAVTPMFLSPRGNR
jgi:hypothetical protein